MSTSPLDIINDAQNNINNIANNNKYQYVYNDNVQFFPVSFQALCHDEYGLNIPTFVAKQYWDIDARIPDCELNAFTIYSNWKHNELLELAKGTITKTQGLLKKKAIVTDTFSVHSFTNDTSIEIQLAHGHFHWVPAMNIIYGWEMLPYVNIINQIHI